MKESTIYLAFKEANKIRERIQEDSNFTYKVEIGNPNDKAMKEDPELDSACRKLLNEYEKYVNIKVAIMSANAGVEPVRYEVSGKKTTIANPIQAIALKESRDIILSIQSDLVSVYNAAMRKREAEAEKLRNRIDNLVKALGTSEGKGIEIFEEQKACIVGENTMTNYLNIIKDVIQFIDVDVDAYLSVYNATTVIKY